MTAVHLRRGLRASLALAGLTVALGVGVSPAQSNSADGGSSSGCRGVAVVIDNGSSISTRCASGSPSSAMAALMSVAVVKSPAMFGGSVVCRIDEYPTSDPCERMPPANAYWAFFHAETGGSWTYSQVGVASYHPPTGSVIGFRFGAGSSPRIRPPASGGAGGESIPEQKAAPRQAQPPPKKSSQKPAVRPSASPAPGTASRRNAPGAGGPASSPQAPSASTSTTRPTMSGTSSTSATTPASPGVTTGADGVVQTESVSAEQAAATSSATDSGGTVGPVLAGLGLIAALGGSAAVTARRRAHR